MVTEHVVQFFDDAESLATNVGAFLAQGLAAGNRLLVVAKPLNWQAVADHLRDCGHDVATALERRRLVVLDASEALAGFMRKGSPDPIAFEESIGDRVRRMRADPENRLRIYGEMVEILAAEGNYCGAHELEQLWNELGHRESFTLLCGYSTAHFAAIRAGSALRDICDAHSHVEIAPEDALAAFLVSRARQAAAPRKLKRQSCRLARWL